MSVVWNTVKTEIDKRINGLRDELERASGDDVIRIQARLRAYRDVLTIPDDARRREERIIGDDASIFQ